MSRIRRLGSAAELAAATGDHPVAVLDVGAGFVPPSYAALAPEPDDASIAVAFHRRSDHGVPGSAVLGTASGLAVSWTTRRCVRGSPAAATGTSAFRAARWAW